VKGEVRVAVGLPAKYWQEQKNLGKNGKIEVLKNTLLSKRVKEVLVLPQGMGGIRCFLKRKRLTSRVCYLLSMLDSTLLYTHFTNQTGIPMSSDCCGSRFYWDIIEYSCPKPTVLLAPLSTPILTSKSTLILASKPTPILAGNPPPACSYIITTIFVWTPSHKPSTVS
jgi:hypothetical protein